MEDLIAPSYEEIMTEIRKKIGERPERDTKICLKGNGRNRHSKVLEERYLVKNDNLEAIETPEDMVWRVAWEIASAEARWGAKRKDVEKLSKRIL